MQVWDVGALECLQTLAGHTGPVRTLVYSGGHMFSGSYDKTVRMLRQLWENPEPYLYPPDIPDVVYWRSIWGCEAHQNRAQAAAAGGCGVLLAIC